ncbi:hypothetical protein BDV96DRAFT_334977 [Lophiotrema nucula]|uniref:Methyltransferase n=1 Tax=Lophiotrema nucula TaxID=690887 RepID=A0A6A5YH13_9PLEO|nr:hypothetical protein BDV96DRAFT_334977 [Lophiotrema nucula]
MTDVTASIEFLADSPRYKTERPYIYHPGIKDGCSADDPRLTNISFASIDVFIPDVRSVPAREQGLDVAGFEVVEHESNHLDFLSAKCIEEYQEETENLLREHLQAEAVMCCRSILRLNAPRTQDEIVDIGNPLTLDRPPRGAHVDFTFEGAPTLIHERLREDLKAKYFQPGYRFRLVNTWRPLLPVVEDRPLAVCDFRSINPQDLLSADRITPNRTSELYYLLYRKSQSWF